jgi:hypothetical protein
MTIDATIARLRDRGRQAIAERDAERDRNAREMPETVPLFRELYRMFGGGCVRLRENGRTLEIGEPQVIPVQPILRVSELVAQMADGRIQPTGEVRAKKRKPIAYEVADE